MDKSATINNVEALFTVPVLPQGWFKSDNQYHKENTMAVKKGTAKKKAPVKKKLKAKTAPTKKRVAAKKTTTAKKPVTKKSPPKKPIAKKTPPKKKAATKKSPARKKAPAKRKLSAISQRYSKTDIVNELAVNSGLNRKQVGQVLDELSVLISRHIKKRAVGEFVLAGLIKVTTVKRPAKKAHRGINPFTGEMTDFKAKPASTAVKVHALKGLKDMAQ
jgi:nucleoid DNA-binding protein